MKKFGIGVFVGWVAGVAALVIGLREYANDPLIVEEMREAIPGVGTTIQLALKGSLYICGLLFAIGFLIVIVGYIHRKTTLSKYKKERAERGRKWEEEHKL